MEKKVTINKLQFIASLSAASYMLGKTDEAALSELIQDFNKKLAPHLKENWETNVILTEYEEAEYKE